MGETTDDPLALARARAAARARILQMQGAAAPTATDPYAAIRATLPEGATLLGTFADNGRVFEMPDGSLQAVSREGATNDAARVQRIMEAGSFAAVEQQDQDRARIAAHPVAARVQEFNRGAPFVGSYLDEAVGLVSPQARDNMRALSGAMQRENPGETAGLNIAGGLAYSAPLAVAAGSGVGSAMSGAPTYVRAGAGLVGGAVAGGTEGAVYGYGEGTDAASRRAQAGQGALFGGVVGGGLGAVLAGGSGAIRNLIENLKGSDTNAIAKALGIAPEAARVVRRALSVGGVDEAVAALERAGPNAMLADAGMPARQLLDAAVQTGGHAGQIARTAIRDRTQAEARAMTAELDRVLGAPRGEDEIIRSVREGTQPARSAAYNEAYGSPIDYAAEPGRRIESLLRRVPSGALRRADDIMRTEGVQSKQVLITQNPATGEPMLVRLPDVRELHYIMQGLDDVVRTNDGMGALGGQTTLGRAYAGLRGQLSDALTQAVPTFGTAQRVAGDAIRRREAVDLGYNLLRPGTRREDVAEGVGRMAGGAETGRPGTNLPAHTAETELTPLDAARALSPADLGRALHGMPASERQAARQGLRAFIDDTLANVARTITDPDTATREGIKLLRDMSSRANRTKLRVLLGPRDAEALLARVDEAATAFELRAAIAENSRTAIRQGIQGAVRQEAEGGIVRSLMRGEPIDATKALTQAMTGETADAVQLREMGLYADIARALTQIRGPEARAALHTIQQAMRGQPLSAAQAERVAGALVMLPIIPGERLSAPFRERGQLPPPR